MMAAALLGASCLWIWMVRFLDPSKMAGGGIADPPRMVGYHEPKSRGFLFPEEFLESPSDRIVYHCNASDTLYRRIEY